MPDDRSNEGDESSDAGESSETNESPVVSAADLDWDSYEHGQRSYRRKQLGAAAGGEKLGTSLYELEPGNRTWPLHYHASNEEAIYVLDGRLTMWLGSGEDKREFELETGDYVAFPVGPDYAHEVEARGDQPARFLVVSTMNDPDLSIQPEREVAMLLAGSPPGSDDERYLSEPLDMDATADYWDTGGDE